CGKAKSLLGQSLLQLFLISLSSSHPQGSLCSTNWCPNSGLTKDKKNNLDFYKETQIAGISIHQTTVGPPAQVIVFYKLVSQQWLN
ncbi:hypothetical protein PPACK8108_LOCUS17499, partial [Phakopsora pachyrhizi]